MKKATFQTKNGTTLHSDEAQAVEDFARQVSQPEISGVIFFCSPKYDLARLGPAIKSAFPQVPVIGCTGAGQLGPNGYQRGGLSGVSLASQALTLTPYLVPSLRNWSDSVTSIVQQVFERRALAEIASRAFGLMLVDGLSLMEERLTAALYQSLNNIPIVGGSAGDDLSFEKTCVYFDGSFLTDAALFALFETTLPFEAFKFQHFEPTDRFIVITGADAERRIVTEMNGLPATSAYSEAVGIPEDKLDARVFSENPLLMNIEGEVYVRSISRPNPDQSLTFFCAIEEGLVLRLGRTTDPLETAQRAFAAVSARLHRPELVIGCDSILRRLEFEQKGLDGSVGQLLSEHRVVGFSTYGEQYNAVHVNQTFTGVAIGSQAHE